MAIEAQLADGRVLRFPDGTKPEVIDSVVQNLLAEGKPAPAQQSAPTPTMGAGTGAETAQPEPAQPAPASESAPKPRTSSFLPPVADPFGINKPVSAAKETQPKAPGFNSVLQDREPEYDEAALIRASRRDFVEAGNKKAERLTAVGKQKLDMQAAARERIRKEAKDENYGFLDFAKDTGIDLSKGVVGLGESYVGLLNLTSGGAAGRVLNSMGYSPDRTTEFLNGFQSLTRKNARQSVKEAEGFVNTLVALAVNPTELLGSVVESLPGTVAAGSVGGRFVRSIVGKATLEAEGLGLVGQQAKDFIVQKVKDQTYRIAAVAGGAEGAMTAGSIAEKARQKDRDWSEYVIPAITAGFGTAAISAVSGKAAQKLGIGDVETSIATRSAGISGVATGEGSYIAKMLKGVAKEGLLEEMPQSAQEQMFTNLATGRPWDENVSKAAAQGLLAGMTMAGGHTTLVSALQKTSELAKEPGAPVQVVPEEKRVEPTFDEAAFMQPEPPAATAPTPAAPTPAAPTPAAPTPAAPTPVAQTAETAEQIKEIAARLQKRGISRRAALAMAEAEVNSKLKAEAKTAATKLPEGRVEEITQELIAAGVPPQQAKIDAQTLAQEEAQADELAQTEAGGTPNVAGPISEPARASAELVEQPSAEPTAAGVGDDQRDGVVPAGPATTDTTVGESAQPTALEEAPVTLTKGQQKLRETLDSNGRIFIDDRDEGGKKTYYAKGVGSISTDLQVELQLTPEEKKAARLAEADIELAETQEERDAGKRALEDALRPAADRATKAPAPTEEAAAKPAETKSVEETEAERIKAEDEQTAAYEAKKDKARSIARSNASAAFDQAGEYGSLDEALDSYRTNMVDTLAEEGLRDDPDYVYLLAAAERAFEAEVNKQRGTTTDGTATTETVQTETQKQEAPAAAGVTKGKRGRPPSPHVVVKNAEGGFDHVLNGEVLGSYANQKQATAAVNLAKSKDKGDADLIAKNQAKLDAALASKGRGRPEKAPTEGGAPALDNEAKSELAELESALETYNSPAEQESILNAAMYIDAVANDTSLPKAVRERAQQMLDEDVDPKDVARGKTLRSTEKNVGKADTGFNKATTGAQAIAQVIRTGNAFQRFVAQRIRNFLAGVKFVVLEEGDAIPAKMEGARGLFVYDAPTKTRTVYVRGASFGGNQGINNITVLHELLHAATAQRIGLSLIKGIQNIQLKIFKNQMEALARRVKEAYELDLAIGEISPEMEALVDGTIVIDEATGEARAEIFSSPDEFLAYGMSSPVFQKFLMGVKGRQGGTTGFSAFVTNIRELFGIKENEATAFTDLVNITDKMLSTRMEPVAAARGKSRMLQQKAPLTEEQKAQRAKEKAVSRAIKAVDRSFEAEKISEETSVLQRLRSLNVAPLLKEAVKGMSTVQRKIVAKGLSTPLVAEIGGINVPELVNTNRLLEEMEASKMELLRAGAAMVEDIKRLLPTEQSLKKVSRAALTFTASRIDPRVDKSVPRLNKIYNDLTANEKKALDEIAGYYEDIANNFDYILGENVKALRPGDAAKLTAALREVFGKDNRIPFYVPLARGQNGKFYLRVGTTEFHIRKTEAERDRLAEAIAKERNTTVEQLLQDKEIEVGNDIEVLRKKVLDSSDALRKLFLMIDDADFTAEEHGASLQKAKDGMKDSVFQLWLHMQPESSSRKQFIHRNKYPPAGFRTDIIQNLSESVLKFSNNLPRLEYAPQLRRSISQANASIENRPEYTPYVSEMALRVDDTLAPAAQSMALGVARFANSFTFGYYMSESTALLQLLSVYQVGTAQLAKKYPMAAVAKEMAKMSQVWNTLGVKNEYGEWVMPTIEQALNLKSRPSDSAQTRLYKEQDRAFIDAMHERNVSESTGARDLMGYKDLPTEKYGTKYEQAKRIGRFVVGGLIHATERMSREFMFMSSAHLIRDKAVAEFRKTAEYQNAPDKIAAERAFGEANLNKWADQAAKDTNAALFNYSESAKPRYMRGPVGKIALQFFTYTLNVGAFIARNFIGMIKPLPGETRVECMRAFSTLMATTFSLGGTSALFGGPIVIAFLSSIMKASKGEDEPDELKDLDLYERFKVFVYEQLGDVTIGGKSLAQIVDQGPVNAFTGLDVSSRISVSNVLTPPDVKAGNTLREGALGYAQLIGGPNLQSVLAVADGVDLFIKGEHYRGIEKMMPWAAVRNKMTAARQKIEGEKGLKYGDDVIEAELFKTGELLGQSVGLRPVLLSDVAAANRKARELYSKALTKRQDILDRLDRTNRSGDDQAYLAVLEEEAKFNAKVSLLFPLLQITDEGRYNFLKNRDETRGTSYGGFQYTPQNQVIAEQVTRRSREALLKREKEVAERKKAEKEKSPR
jgi:hypothetical protein